MTELSNSRMATGDAHGYLTLFAVDDDKGQWTKKKRRKDMIERLLLFVN